MLRIILVVAAACAAMGCGSSPDEPGPFDEVPLDESLKVDGLEAPVEIVRDEFGVPHIYARHMRDLGFANGYAVACDRIQQMDLSNQRKFSSPACTCPRWNDLSWFKQRLSVRNQPPNGSHEMAISSG